MTHGVTYLPQVDVIVVMKNGSISESGSFDELLNSKGDFSEFLVTYLEENLESDDEGGLNKSLDNFEIIIFNFFPDLDKLKDILVEKKIVNEIFSRKSSIISECGSIASFNRYLNFFPTVILLNFTRFTQFYFDFISVDRGHFIVKMEALFVNVKAFIIPSLGKNLLKSNMLKREMLVIASLFLFLG